MLGEDLNLECLKVFYAVNEHVHPQFTDIKSILIYRLKTPW